MSFFPMLCPQLVQLLLITGVAGEVEHLCNRPSHHLLKGSHGHLTDSYDKRDNAPLSRGSKSFSIFFFGIPIFFIWSDK